MDMNVMNTYWIIELLITTGLGIVIGWIIRGLKEGKKAW